MRSAPISLRRSVLILGATLALSIVAGCGDTVHVGPSAPAGPEYVVELEPNDFPEWPDFIGVLDDLSYLVVQGNVEAIGFDIVDHIEFEAQTPLEIEFYLDGLGPIGDVDVTIYDPIAHVVLGTYAGPGDESGTIVVHEAYRPFQFVIEAFDVETDWDLEIVAFPYSCGGCALDGPSASHAPGAPVEHEHEAWLQTDAPEKARDQSRDESAS